MGDGVRLIADRYGSADDSYRETPRRSFFMHTNRDSLVNRGSTVRNVLAAVVLLVSSTYAGTCGSLWKRQMYR